MIAREQLKSKIELIDESYLNLAFQIICQFPHTSVKKLETKKAVDILQEIADSGGLGINDPVAWQHEVRQDRILPFRND